MAGDCGPDGFFVLRKAEVDEQLFKQGDVGAAVEATLEAILENGHQPRSLRFRLAALPRGVVRAPQRRFGGFVAGLGVAALPTGRRSGLIATPAAESAISVASRAARVPVRFALITQ